MTSQATKQARSHILDLCSPAATEEISDKVLGLPLGKPLSSLRTPLQTQWSGVAARFTTEQKHHLPFSKRFFIVYCAALWRLCAGYLRVCRVVPRPVREPAYSCHPPSRRGDQWRLHFL